MQSFCLSENSVNLELFGSSTAKKVNYLPAYKGEKIKCFGAFSFQNVDIHDNLIINNLKAFENSIKTEDISWNIIPGASYILYRKAEGEQSFIKIQELITTQLSYNNVNVTPDKSYTYRIQAISNLSESEAKELIIKTSPALFLPVTVVSYLASRLNESTVKLSRKTTMEVNNFQFEIQRSVFPESGFVSIGSVDGTGSSDGINNYEFKDNNDLFQWTYYRLKQLDLNGSFTYSRIIFVQPFRLKLTVASFPNASVNGSIQFGESGLDSPVAISITI